MTDTDVRAAIAAITTLRRHVAAGKVPADQRAQLRAQVRGWAKRIDALTPGSAWYAPTDDVPARVRMTAERALSDAAGQLGLPYGLTIAWFQPANRSAPGAWSGVARLQGQYRGGEECIHLNATLGVADAARIARHEIRHLWQLYAGHLDDRERDAKAFEAIP